MTENHTPRAAHTDDTTATTHPDQPTQVIHATPVAPPPYRTPIERAASGAPAAEPAYSAPSTRTATLELGGPVRAEDDAAVRRVPVGDRAPLAPGFPPAEAARNGSSAVPGAVGGAGAPSAGAAVGAGAPPGPDAWPFTGGPHEDRPRPRRPRWMPLAGTAAAAALLASFATAGLTGAFEADQSAATTSSLDGIGQNAGNTVPVVDSTSDDPDWERVAASVSASVVAIEVATAAGGGGEGSGVIIDDAGHILTNNHVVAGARDGTVQVTLTDGRLYEATVVGTDPSTDLAIIRIDDAADDLSPAALGDSDGVAVGSPVMAVGNPLGLANTVTTGIVSAVDRPVSASSSDGTGAGEVVVTNAIQIDAAINPGNSGGPLFDAEGRVVGITSSIATLSGGSQSGSIGLGFAIPVNLAREVGEQLIEDGTAQHAFLGVSLSDGTATADGITRRGAVVEQVTPDSPAEGAGLEIGDVIVAIDGDAVAGSESLTAFVRERLAGEEAELTVVREGEALDVPVTLAVREVPAVSSQGGSGTPEEGSQGSDGSEGSEGLEVPGLDGSSVPGGTPFDWFGGQG